ncbi:hypothetical protein VHP8226_03268 [Vibrio hippocampi]|uniref:YnhF family membrane protein n=1 Tax=Vibrio hippocampi TaxID=654686 RepID=A0ABM8ZLZ1_9VIBR|nr:hypothetical protein VHP8226_03268 [Vibrio hippocampi]
MNFAAELFFDALTMILSIVVISVIIAKIINRNSEEEK